MALFASNFRKKREAYRGSEFAPRVLAEHGINVVMKSDHPVVNSHYLLHEATQAHYYGLNPTLALLPDIYTPATTMGMGHRIGMLKPGYDADIVMWSSHPLSLASTPTQVYIDGIPQLSLPEQYIAKGPTTPPRTPNFDSEKVATVTYEGIPPLEPRSVKAALFVNVSELYMRGGDSSGVMRVSEQAGSVGVEDGRVVCVGQCSDFAQGAVDVVDLEGGTIIPGLTSFGSPLGLVEIRLEPSTNDGRVHNPLDGDLPAVLGDKGPSCISTAFSPGAAHARVENASIVDEVALHVATLRAQTLWRRCFGSCATGAHLLAHEIAKAGVSVIVTQSKPFPFTWEQRRMCRITIGGHCGSSRTQKLSEYGVWTGDTYGLDAKGLGQTHLNLSQNVIGGTPYQSGALFSYEGYPEEVILRVGISFVSTDQACANAEEEIVTSSFEEIQTASKALWQEKLSKIEIDVANTPPNVTEMLCSSLLAGPPITQESLVTALLKAGVNVAIAVNDEYNARNTRFEVGSSLLMSNAVIDRTTALALATTNLEKALGVQREMPQDLVAYRGGDVFEFEAKVVGVLSDTLGRTDLFV
ncbi:hypothetical protein EV702DRAFT_1250810 [Suillus placidus]|uniref:Amidohydrolase-related domain-containing protein n=1 Tax=Suillus placidus TaxID=48579 RepID=A0A9P6ZK41_9AGAM|nr:hypothetical protein EV702DRAFT_1250810 [Suillus placidus]